MKFIDMIINLYKRLYQIGKNITYNNVDEISINSDGKCYLNNLSYFYTKSQITL